MLVHQRLDLSIRIVIGLVETACVPVMFLCIPLLGGWGAERRLNGTRHV